MRDKQFIINILLKVRVTQNYYTYSSSLIIVTVTLYSLGNGIHYYTGFVVLVASYIYIINGAIYLHSEGQPKLGDNFIQLQLLSNNLVIEPLS